MFNIIQNRKIWLSFSGILVAVSLVFISIWGLNLGIDFTGGALLEVEFEQERPNKIAVDESLSKLNLDSLVTQPVGEKGMIIRFQNTSEEEHQAVITELKKLINNNTEIELNLATGTDEQATSTAPAIEIDSLSLGGLTELRFDAVGPSIGEELKSRSITAMIIVLIAIVAYIAWVFRKVSKPVESWKFGLSAIIALFHDVIIIIGIFAFLGEFYGIEVNTAFIAAILTVLGYSVNDTIVVFDRVRENLPKSEEDFESTINTSVNQTIKRSLNTSITTLLVLGSVLLYGGESIRSFVLALSIGVFIGTYSSIFLASPVLVVWEKFKK
ncbi:MAG: protein translocase subunit SecF [Patescibacteria group bacterium]|nr:protein translocase subunit SecF [Patescibacteria group bacterium]